MFVLTAVLPAKGALALFAGAIFATAIFFARSMWWRFRPTGSLSEKFLAWEVELLAEQRWQSLAEIRSWMITRSGLTEEQIETLLPEEERARWNEAFEQSIGTLKDLVREYDGYYYLSKVGLTIAAKRRAFLSRDEVRKVRKIAFKKDKKMETRVRKTIRDYPEPYAYREAAEPPRAHDIMTLDIGREFESTVEREPPPTVEPVPLRDLGPGVIEKPRDFPVWFGTNRKPKNAEDLAQGFTGKEGDRTFYGRCFVNIPRGHKPGETQPAFLERALLGKQGVSAKTIEGLTEDEFWGSLAQTLRKDHPANSMLLFIHGYNVSFVEAAIRTGQLKYDLGMDHAAFFSWPSLRRLWGYGSDSTTARGAAEYLAPFLTRLGALTKEEEINLHVIAHSMGNEAFVYALEMVLADLKGDTKNFRLAELVFAAPDVDAKIFRNKTTRTIKMSRQRTLYASRKDRPLGFSGLLRIRRSRAGRIPPVTIVNQVDTIDVSYLDLSLLGHGYVAELRPVITDMSTAMHFGAAPVKRVGLEGAGPPSGRYWVIS